MKQLLSPVLALNFYITVFFPLLSCLKIFLYFRVSTVSLQRTANASQKGSKNCNISIQLGQSKVFP